MDEFWEVVSDLWPLMVIVVGVWVLGNATKGDLKDGR